MKTLTNKLRMSERSNFYFLIEEKNVPEIDGNPENGS